MKKITIFLAVILVAAVVASASWWMYSTPAAADEANALQMAQQLADDGQFVQAAAVYQRLVDQSYSEPALYYNMGNAYLQAGDTGRAILNYRRAAQVAPRDADLQANLTLARTQAGSPNNAWWDHPWSSLPGEISRRWLSMNELAGSALLGWFGLVLLLILWRGLPLRTKTRAGLRLATVVVGLLFAVSATTFASRLYDASRYAPAVIVADKVMVMAGPSTGHASLFSLENGLEVSVAATRGPWQQIVLSNGQSAGWLPADAIEMVSIHSRFM